MCDGVSHVVFVRLSGDEHPNGRLINANLKRNTGFRGAGARRQTLKEKLEEAGTDGCHTKKKKAADIHPNVMDGAAAWPRSKAHLDPTDGSFTCPAHPPHPPADTP